MIRSLRQIHRRGTIVLGLFLPVALGIGLALRQPVPRMDALPAGLTLPEHRFPFAERERDDLFPKSKVGVRLWREHSAAGRYAVQLMAAPDFVKPDLLVYWIAGPPKKTDIIPSDARLLGVMGAPAIFPLPAGVLPRGGILMLYSLADNEVVDISKPLESPTP